MRASAYIVALLTVISSGSGCSEDRPAPEPDDNTTIVFTLTAERIATTTATIGEFNVTAYTDNAEIMNHVNVTRTGDNTWTYYPPVEWPQLPVNFIAISPSDVDYSVNKYWEHNIHNYECTGKEDLLIATAYNCSQGTGKQTLNFRHALINVIVKIYTPEPEKDVKVTRVQLRELAGVGDYYFPKTTTASGGDNYGSWTTYYNGAYYTVFDNDTLQLTATPQTANNTDIEFFIPSKLNDLQTEGYVRGSCIAVTYTVGDGGTSSTAYYPLASVLTDNTWKSGTQYIYTLRLNP